MYTEYCHEHCFLCMLTWCTKRTWLTGYFVAPLPTQPQERPHPQVPAQPFRDQLSLKGKGQVSLRKVPTLRRGSREGGAPQAWSQSVWRWRVRGQREALNLLSVFWFSSFFSLNSVALYWILLCGHQLYTHPYEVTETCPYQNWLVLKAKKICFNVR